MARVRENGRCVLAGMIAVRNTRDGIPGVQRQTVILDFQSLPATARLEHAAELEKPLAVAGVAHAAADEERAHGGFGQEA